MAVVPLQFWPSSEYPLTLFQRGPRNRKAVALRVARCLGPPSFFGIAVVYVPWVPNGPQAG